MLIAAITIAGMHQLELWAASDKAELSAASNCTTARVELAPSRVRTASDEGLGRAEMDESAVQYLRAARADSTRRAYETGWRLFEVWCTEQGLCALPTTTMTLGRYLVQLARNVRKPSTIRRARKVVGFVHKQRGLPRPDQDLRIRLLAWHWALPRLHGSREEGATPLLVPDLERMVRALGSIARDSRDRALLLLGFAGAFRLSELVNLDVSDLEPIAEGLRIHVRRNREDQLGGVPIFKNRNHPVRVPVPVNVPDPWSLVAEGADRVRARARARVREI